MTDKDQDPFDQFEELPIQEVIPDEDTSSGALDSLDECLRIAYNVLSGNILPIIRLGNDERNELLVYLGSALRGKGAESPPGELPWEAAAKPPSPSQEEASRVVQSPEEAQKEQEFLDTLGI